jgi:hypothetical protein
MTDQMAFNPASIPPIGSMPTAVTSSVSAPQKVEKPLTLLDNAPNDVTFGEFLGKVVVGLVIG